MTCAGLHQATFDENPERVGLFADHHPNCSCERESLVPTVSPGLISNDEPIARIVCSPMHVHKKQPKLMTNFFSHVVSYGASVQRLAHATDTELVECIKGLVTGSEDRAWLGYTEASASEIRAKTLRKQGEQSFSILDSALSQNPAHAEIHCAYRIPEADVIEYRHELLKVFGGETAIKPRKNLREGKIWSSLPNAVTDREVPPQWAALI